MEASQLKSIPDDARSLAELLAERCDISTGRIELIFDEGRYVDGYKQERMKPSQLQTIAGVFCQCLIDTTAVDGACVVCGLPKRPR